MTFDHQQFSKTFKQLKADYLEGKLPEQALHSYVEALQTVDLQTLQTDHEKMAFWINIYNGLTNYWVIKKRLKKTMLESPLLVMTAKMPIGGYTFTLDDIEHGILRGNRRSTYKLWRQFGKRDPRAALQVSTVDYRIHFALNCGAQSCPPIAFYSVQHLEQQLTMAEESFVEQEFRVNADTLEIYCSKIFWLYKRDFENIYINDPAYKQYKVRYLPYDFSIN